MTNAQTAIKEAIFALEHGNKTWKALDILKSALAWPEQPEAKHDNGVTDND